MISAEEARKIADDVSILRDINDKVSSLARRGYYATQITGLTDNQIEALRELNYNVFLKEESTYIVSWEREVKC